LLKNEIGCQRSLTGVLTGLCGCLLSSCEDDICEGPYVIGNDIPLATSSVGYQDAFLNSILDEVVYMEQPPCVVARGRVRRFAG